MYRSFEYQGQIYYSWGRPTCLLPEEVHNLQERYDVNIYNGKPPVFDKDDSVLAMIDGGGGFGDRIWLLNFFRDIYRIKGRRKCRFAIYSDSPTLDFCKYVLPSSFEFRQGYVPESVFNSYTHKLPSLHSWRDRLDHSDRSWVDNKSILQRMYMWAGMQYDGLADWGEFTDERVLYPVDEFYRNLNINKADRFVFFQWHSQGPTKNLSPRVNVKLIKHILKRYGHKVYVIGSMEGLDVLNDIPGVVNLSGKTQTTPEALLHFAFASEFVVCPDSAGVHLAEAYKTPCVCILSTLPPVYIASKYRIPAFMYGSSFCPYRPCGVTAILPKDTKCPQGTVNYCKVLDEIDLSLFDACVEQSMKNRLNYRRAEAKSFYTSQDAPISME